MPHLHNVDEVLYIVDTLLHSEKYYDVYPTKWKSEEKPKSLTYEFLLYFH